MLGIAIGRSGSQNTTPITSTPHSRCNMFPRWYVDAISSVEFFLGVAMLEFPDIVIKKGVYHKIRLYNYLLNCW